MDTIFLIPVPPAAPKEPQVLLSNFEVHQIPKQCMDHTERSLKATFPMTEYCEENLTCEKYGPLPSMGKYAMGFYFTKEPSGVKTILEELAELSKQTGRKFRAGSPFELLFYIIQGFKLPKFFITIGHIWNNKVLFWYPFFGNPPRFHLYHWEGKWRIDGGIFIVEELS
ncbi:MAG: hypothetical protein V4686_02995 [Patescibacteria group bacterium]